MKQIMYHGFAFYLVKTYEEIHFFFNFSHQKKEAVCTKHLIIQKKKKKFLYNGLRNVELPR